MTFALSPLLFLLLLIPGFVALYVALVKRRAQRVKALAAQGFGLTPAALRMRKRRHIPYAFFLVGLTLLILAVARPQTSVSVPRREGTVILAFDVSNSMKADDLAPSRIEAAKKAARAFVDRQPDTIQIGVVAFSDSGLATQQPTKDREAVRTAISRLTAQGGTSLGQGIFASLSAIAGEALAIDPEQLERLGDSEQGPNIGYYGSAAVILLSDGENRARPDPIEIAKLASTAGVKIYPIGIGKPGGTVVDVDGFKLATALDEQLLTEIASTTDGTYFAAEDEESLTKVYSSIDLKWKRVKEFTEVTGLATAASAVLMTIGAGLSLLWFGRMV